MNSEQVNALFIQGEESGHGQVVTRWISILDCCYDNIDFKGRPCGSVAQFLHGRRESWSGYDFPPHFQFDNETHSCLIQVFI